MAPLQPPSTDEILLLRERVSVHNPGVGLIDTRTGLIYLRPASTFDGGDHLGLAEAVLGIHDISQAGDLRGFIVLPDSGGWKIVNVSGLNPHEHKMEKPLFNAAAVLLESLLGHCSTE